MGLIGRLLDLLFGNGRNAVAETLEVFRENAEAAGGRSARARGEALAQFAAEFARPRKGWFDRFIDGLNRLPRPFLAFGTIGLFITAMVDPVWFATRMSGIALVPDPLWWLMGAIVSFYFGARHQAKTQEFQRSVAETVARAPAVAAQAARIAAPKAPPEPAVSSVGPGGGEVNAALEAWRAGRG